MSHSFLVLRERCFCITLHSHDPSNWKIGTLRNLVKRAKSINSSEPLLRNNIIDQELSQPTPKQGNSTNIAVDGPLFWKSRP